MGSDSNGGLLVSFDATVFSVESVKKAAYRFLDSFSSEIWQEDGHIHCRITFKEQLPAEQQESCVASLRSEVLDQDLRRSIAHETDAFRNAILALAFSPITSKRDE